MATASTFHRIAQIKRKLNFSCISTKGLSCGIPMNAVCNRTAPSFRQHQPCYLGLGQRGKLTCDDRAKEQKAREVPVEFYGSPDTKVGLKWRSKILERGSPSDCREGYHAFSMRSIAQRSGIHLKSLPYTSAPSKILLNAVVEYTIEKILYFQPYRDLFAKKSASTPPSGSA